MINRKALIKESNEILDVEGYYSVHQMTFTLPIELEGKLKDMKWSFPSFDIKTDKIPEVEREGDYYILSDGKKYTGSELVVGLNNIRNYKFEKLLK